MNITIGTNIKRLRMAKDITQEQLAVAMNITNAAVSKWERGETYPDITLLQPLAYFFGVTIDELMGYNREKIRSDIDSVIALYKEYFKTDYKKAREIIVKAYGDYPNDYRIMHYYMWSISGDMAENDPSTLIEHKDEFLAICEKLLDGCTEEILRLSAWNMMAKINHAEGNTEEALEIYRTKFASWFDTCGQKTEQLFAKNTDEYYFYVQKNMYELVDFAADKLGRTIIFNPSLSMEEKSRRAIQYGDLMLNAFEKTSDDFFLVLAKSFLGRIENDLVYRGGTDEQVIAVMDKRLYAVKKLSARMSDNAPLRHSYNNRLPAETHDLLQWTLKFFLNATEGRRKQLLNNPAYLKVLSEYK